MVKKADRAIVDKRLEDTLDLFEPTAQREGAAALESDGHGHEVTTSSALRNWSITALTSCSAR